jgi:hypothetical protein
VIVETNEVVSSTTADKHFGAVLCTPGSHSAFTGQHLHVTSPLRTTAVSEHLENSTELGIMRRNVYSMVQKAIFGTLLR